MPQLIKSRVLEASAFAASISLLLLTQHALIVNTLNVSAWETKERPTKPPLLRTRSFVCATLPGISSFDGCSIGFCPPKLSSKLIALTFLTHKSIGDLPSLESPPGWRGSRWPQSGGGGVFFSSRGKVGGGKWPQSGGGSVFFSSRGKVGGGRWLQSIIAATPSSHNILGSNSVLQTLGGFIPGTHHSLLPAKECDEDLSAASCQTPDSSSKPSFLIQPSLGATHTGKYSNSNIPPSILEKLGRCLHNHPNHPIEMIKRRIYAFFMPVNFYPQSLRGGSKGGTSDAHRLENLLEDAETPPSSSRALMQPLSPPSSDCEQKEGFMSSSFPPPGLCPPPMSHAPPTSHPPPTSIRPPHPLLSDLKFKAFDSLNPIVSTHQNFDNLLIPPNHPSRSRRDTYYVDDTLVLRTHTTAHQLECVKEGNDALLIAGDVYRRDQIDRFHYPVFHQLECVVCNSRSALEAKHEMFEVISALIDHLLPDCKAWRIQQDFFPFTFPSYDVEVYFKGSWVEILGCGVVHPTLQAKFSHALGAHKFGWAFGLGLERIAMMLFEIPDIRLFWSSSKSFLEQFASKSLWEEAVFKPFSTVAPISKDISFWISDDEIVHFNTEKAAEEDAQDSPLSDVEAAKKMGSKEASDVWGWTRKNDFFDVLREESCDLIEEAYLVDKFFHPSERKYSHTYRLTFSPTADIRDPGEFQRIINLQMESLRNRLVKKMMLSLR